MTEPSALDTVRHCSPLFLAAGGAFMLHPEVLGPCRDHGYPNGFVYYVRGRGGVLGEVDADIVSSAFGFFNPTVVRGMWEAGIGVEPARDAARRYGRAAADWGAKRLDGVAGLDRFAELARRVVDAADLVGMTLFAGWRAEPETDDPAGRAYVLTHVLREWRGSAHVVATAASGLSASESILADPKGGAATAKLFGWGEDLPAVDDSVQARRRAAEELTDQLLVPAYSTLTGPERAEFCALADALGAAISGS